MYLVYLPGIFPQSLFLPQILSATICVCHILQRKNNTIITKLKKRQTTYFKTLQYYWTSFRQFECDFTVSFIKSQKRFFSGVVSIRIKSLAFCEFLKQKLLGEMRRVNFLLRIRRGKRISNKLSHIMAFFTKVTDMSKAWEKLRGSKQSSDNENKLC